MDRSAAAVETAEPLPDGVRWASDEEAEARPQFTGSAREGVKVRHDQIGTLTEPYDEFCVRYAAAQALVTDRTVLLRHVRSLFEAKVAEARTRVLFEHEPPDRRSLGDIWPFLHAFEHYHAIKLPSVRIDFARYPVLTWPWHTDRTVNAMSFIGEGRPRGAYQETTNHRCTFYAPVGLCLTTNGNHNTAVAVLERQGQVTATAYDVSDAFRRYQTDGNVYRRTTDSEIVGKVRDREWAAIFYLARAYVLATDEAADMNGAKPSDDIADMKSSMMP